MVLEQECVNRLAEPAKNVELVPLDIDLDEARLAELIDERIQGRHFDFDRRFRETTALLDDRFPSLRDRGVVAVHAEVEVCATRVSADRGFHDAPLPEPRAQLLGELWIRLDGDDTSAEAGEEKGILPLVGSQIEHQGIPSDERLEQPLPLAQIGPVRAVEHDLIPSADGVIDTKSKRKTLSDAHK